MMLATKDTTTVRRHPDIFTAEEAVAYLHLDSLRSLETLRAEYGLLGRRVGRGMMYHRKDLDKVADRVFGLDTAFTIGETPKLRLSGGRR